MLANSSFRVIEAHARYYRRTWRGSAISTFASPLFVLVAMGIGLGSLVDSQGGPGGVPYLVWLAPGLLAASAMQTAAGDSSYPVMAGIKWTKSYHAALATPVSVPALVLGHFGWVSVRLLMSLTVYAGVMVVVGAIDPLRAVFAIFPAVLTGLAFTTPITAWVAQSKSEQGLASLFRFVIVPLFLFSGTFFPITQLPGWLQPFAFLTPLWHGVELSRGAAGLVGHPYFPWYVHVAALTTLIVTGGFLALRFMERVMRK
ncbi:MAG TPA: ABC transporter permease [Acidimicrobiia bacterium]|nr:ABC transporter permease [Acidimicrobiia bacterium]